LLLRRLARIMNLSPVVPGTWRQGVQQNERTPM
jgi:hypothetical protein